MSAVVACLLSEMTRCDAVMSTSTEGDVIGLMSVTLASGANMSNEDTSLLSTRSLLIRTLLALHACCAETDVSHVMSHVTRRGQFLTL